MTTATRGLPRGPVLDWSSFGLADAPNVPSVEDLAHTAFTTSGRAAIYQALLQLQIPPGSTVLVPSYHCPTMVAPVIVANLKVAYFGLRDDGLPKLDTISEEAARTAKAILVSHYFGQPNSLSEVRQWCDMHNIALIEDCAHCYFGNAGERPIGAWGDFATASLSKFLPVPEGGLLASAHRAITKLQLMPPGTRAQIKGWVDVFELASQNKRFVGLGGLLALLYRIKNAKVNARPTPCSPSATEVVTSANTMLHDCDMARIGQAPLGVTRFIRNALPRGRIITQRQQNYQSYAAHFANITGARPLFSTQSAAVAPYVFPLWVDDAERVYRAIRALALPVFRWDRIWPGTPTLTGDVGPQWSQHVLQLLCHQDLCTADVDGTSQAILKLLSP